MPDQEIQLPQLEPYRSDLGAIARSLRNSCRWVLGRLEDFEDRKRCKVPYSAKTGRRASPTDPEDWSSFDEALNALQDFKPHVKYAHEPRSAFLGYVFGAPFFGIDLDKCRNPETGEVEQWARDFIAKCPPTYVEISISGRGFHLYYSCDEWPKLPAGHRTERAEIYSKGRYFVISGVRAEGSLDDVTNVPLDQALKMFALVEAMKKKPASPTPTTPARKPKLETLMTLVDFPDLSAAVKSLLNELAYTYADAGFIENGFKQSALYQKTHWKEKWDRLGKDEIAGSIEFVRANPRNGRVSGAEAEWDVDVTCGKDAKREHLRFLRYPHLALGKLGLLAGHSSQGKSPVTGDWSARVTRGELEGPIVGGPWSDDTRKYVKDPRSVICLAIEDTLADTIMPRFDLAGGNDELFFHIRGMKCDTGARQKKRTANLQRDFEKIANLAAKTKDLGLIVIDPITNYLGHANMNKEDDVRSILTPLTALAEELMISILTVAHVNRRERGTDPLMRVMGAAAFSGVARSVYIVGPDPDSTSPYSHIITPARGSVGDDALVYHTEIVRRTWEGEESDVVKVVWDGSRKATAEDAVDPTSRKDKGEFKKAGEILREYLKDGKKTAAECTSHLEQAGYDVKALNSSRIRKAAGAGAKQEKKQWWWFLETSTEQEGTF